MAEFDIFANSYEELVTESVRVSGESAEYFAHYKASYLARILGGQGVRSILDYGCGIGSLAKHLESKFPAARIDGYDVSPDSIRSVQTDLLERGNYSSSLDDLGTGYDLVVLSNVLHHVKPEERRGLFREVYSRLTIGGKLVVFEHNPFNPLTRWAVSQCAFDAHAILLKSSETRRRFRKAGFEVLRCDFIVFFPRWLGVFRPFEPLLDWCPCGAQYAICGLKGAN